MGNQVEPAAHPPAPARAYHASHDATPGHKHFTPPDGGRWVTLDDGGNLQLVLLPTPGTNQLVEVLPEEHGQVAFKTGIGSGSATSSTRPCCKR